LSVINAMKNQEQKTILLVEDETVTMMVETHLLKSFGYDVVPAKSGEEAVQIAIGNDKIALILMDVNLGDGIDGPEAAKQILLKRNLPVVFLSSHTDKEYVERIKGIAGYGYVVKNSSNVVLQSSIEMAFNLFDAQAAMQASEGQKNAILNGITTNIALVDKELKILWANKAAANSVNKRSEDMVGHPCYTFWGDPARPCANCPAFMAIQTGQSEHKIVQTPDGKIWDEGGEPVFDAKGNVIAVVEIAQDITARKKVESALQQQAEELRARNDELSRFNRVAIGRELTMIELKREVNDLCGKLGEPPRHRLAEDKTAPPASTEAQA